MKHLVLIHGMGATRNDQWLPFVKNCFQQKGWQVDAVDVPDSNNPELKHWIQHITSQTTVTEDTVVVGHSMGCPAILGFLEESSIRIKQAILVAGFVEPIVDGVQPILRELYDWDIIKNNCKEFIFINSDNDPYGCDDKQGRIMMDKLGGIQIIIPGGGHFGTSEFNQPYLEFPFLVNLISD